MYLLDTNALSELRKVENGKANKSFARWVKTAPISKFYLSSVTIFELARGVGLVERRDPDQGRVLRHWLADRVLSVFQGRILSLDATVAQEAANLHVPDPRPERDAFIAATAKTYGFSVVTRNVKDFMNCGVDVINPWDVAS